MAAGLMCARILPPSCRQVELDGGIFKGFVCDRELGTFRVRVELGDLAAEVVLVAVDEVDVRSFFILNKSNIGIMIDI